VPNTKPILFREFDQYERALVYRRHLPHWRQDGATYFVTFRLADSVPGHVVERWRQRRQVWLNAHRLTDDLDELAWRERYLTVPAPDRAAFERDQARALLTELDRHHGECVLRGPGCGAVMAEALAFFDPLRVRCGDYVVMPNHVHWLVQPALGEELEGLLLAVKRFTATRINRDLGRHGPLWQRESFDRLVRNRAELDRIRGYIAANPATAGMDPAGVARFAAVWC